MYKIQLFIYKHKRYLPFASVFCAKIVLYGEVAEWLKAHAWKVCILRKRYREFESRSLRQDRNDMRNKAFFETSSIYEVDPQDCSLVRRDGDIQSIGWRRDDHGLRFPLQVDGLKRRDLAIFGHILDETGGKKTALSLLCQTQELLHLKNFYSTTPIIKQPN